MDANINKKMDYLKNFNKKHNYLNCKK